LAFEADDGAEQGGYAQRDGGLVNRCVHGKKSRSVR
jgi:hypothetical protein